MLIVGIGSMWATVDTQIIKPSTSTSDPEHVYFMHCLNSDNDFATQNAYASNTAADAAKFAFFQATDANGDAIENAYYIYCVNNSKWMSYTKQNAYSNGKSFVTMSTTDKSSANYFYMGYVTMTASSVNGTKAYAIRPYNNNGLASRYLNWFDGVGNNRSTTIGLYDHGTDDAGSGWAFIEVPRVGRYYRIKSCATNKYLTTSSATDATDNTTLYFYTDKGLAQISSGKYYNGYDKYVGTTQYPATISFNLNANRGAFHFATNGYWAYCKSDGNLDRGTTINSDANYAWDFEEVDGPIAFVPTLNDIREAKWYNLYVRDKYIKYNATTNSYDGNFYDTETSAPSASDKNSWFTFVGDPFKGFKIICFADEATFCSNDVNTDTRIYAGRPEEGSEYVLEVLSLNDNLAWQIRDKRGENAFLNQQNGALGIWNNNARPDIGNKFVITEVDDAVAAKVVTYNIVATDENGENEISWSYDRLYGADQTTGETPLDLPFVSNYSCDDPTLSGSVCSLTYTATHTLPFVSDKYYFMKQRKNNESSEPYNGYVYYDSDRNTNGMPKTKAIGNSENYLWKFVGNPYDGYCIYNKAKGESQGLFMTRSATSLTWSLTPSRVMLNKMETADGNSVLAGGASSTYFKLKGSANNSLHDLGGVLNNWNNSGSVTDPGSIIGFYEAEEYTVTVVAPDGFPGGGGVTANGINYKDGDYFCVVKGTAIEARVVSGYSSNVSISENTISVNYTEITVPSGHNGFIAGYTTIDADKWQTEDNWNLQDTWDSNGPGCPSSGMWSPIYIQDITSGTVPKLEGWNFRMTANHSTYSIADIEKVQGGQSAYITLKNGSNVSMNFGLHSGNGHTYAITVNLSEGNNNVFNPAFPHGYNHGCGGDCNGQITVNYGSVSKNSNRIFNASGSGSINKLILNATLTDPTEDNTIETIPLATFTNVTVTTLPDPTISGADGWTLVDSKAALGTRTEDGKYYYVEKNNSSGVTLYTYKLNAPVKENDGAITVDADITSGVVELINTSITENNATSVDLTASSTTEVTGLEIPANCLVIVNDGTTVNIENNVVVKDGESYSCENLVLTDKVPFKTPVGFTAESITHERTTSSTSAVWGTACLPYPVQSVSGEGDGIRYYQLSESNSKDGVMSFTLITDEISANTPVVFIKSSGADFNFNATNKSVAITPANPEASEVQGMTLVGTLTGSDNVATDDSKDYYYISGNKFWRATGTLKVNPFRAYFTASKGETRNFTLQVVDDGTITRVDSVDGFDVSDEQVYSLDGKRVNSVKKGGIYIIGGNKVIIK